MYLLLFPLLGTSPKYLYYVDYNTKTDKYAWDRQPATTQVRCGIKVGLRFVLQEQWRSQNAEKLRTSKGDY